MTTASGAYRDQSTTDTTPDQTAPHEAGQRDQRPHDATSHDTEQDRKDAKAAAKNDKKDVLSRQKEQFGGIKWGAAFFGWLTAIGTAVLLTALVGAAGAAFGLAATGGGQQATDQLGQAAQDPGTAQTAGIVSAIVALVVLLIAYYCGGYVAGRMARFNGLKQGVAVWVWTIVIAVVIAILVAVAGSRFDVLGSIGGLPQLPADPATMGVAGIITVVAALIVSLVGAVLGGLAGMRFHRKIDRADLGR